MRTVNVSPGRYENIREGWAQAMLLHGKHVDYDIGEQFEFAVQASGEQYMPLEVIVVKIVIMAGEDLCTDEFEPLYINQAGACEWNAVKKAFPKAQKEDTFTIVYFDLL